MSKLLSTEESVKAAKDYLEQKNFVKIPKDYPLKHEWLCSPPDFIYLHLSNSKAKEEQEKRISDWKKRVCKLI
jgi:hypothetical protein